MAATRLLLGAWCTVHHGSTYFVIMGCRLTAMQGVSYINYRLYVKSATPTLLFWMFLKYFDFNYS